MEDQTRPLVVAPVTPAVALVAPVVTPVAPVAPVVALVAPVVAPVVAPTLSVIKPSLWSLHLLVFFSQKEIRPYSGRRPPPLFGPNVHYGPAGEYREDPSFYKLLCKE